MLFSAQVNNEINGLDTVRLQLKGFHTFQFAGYYAAKEKGYYIDHGLDVHILERNPKLSVFNQVVSNEVQYGVGDAEIIAQYAEGAPIKALAAIFQHSSGVFISKRSSGINSPIEMIGKRIMMINENNWSHTNKAPLQAMLSNIGLTENDYTLAHQSFNYRDLIDNKTDVISADITDHPLLLTNQDVLINIINPQNFGFDFYGDFLFTSQAELFNHPNRAERFRLASLKGWKYALNHPEEIIQLIYTKYRSRSSIDILRFEAEEIHNLILPDNIPLGQIDIKRLRKISDIYTNLKNSKHLTDSELNAFIFDRPPSLNLSDEEWEWLEQNPVIRLGIDPNFAPYEWLDSNDKYTGITADYIRLLEPRLDTHFEVINKSKSWPELLNAARRNELDMLFSLIKTPDRSAYLNFTQPYLVSPAVIISGQTQGYIGSLKRLRGKLVAIQKGHSTQELLAKYYPNIPIVLTDSIEQALVMVAEGKAHAYVGDATSASYVLKKEGFANLMFSGQTEYQSEFRIGIPKGNLQLHSILTKALSNISQQEKDEIYARWMGMKISQGIKYKTVIKYVIVTVILFCLFFYWIYRLRLSESALRSSENRLKAMFDAVPDCIKLISAKGKLLQMNPAGLAMFETQDDPSVIIGQSAEHLIAQENRLAFKEMNKQVHKGESQQLVYQIKSIYGHHRWVETHAVPLKSPGSNETAVLAVSHDITEKKIADEKIWRQANFDSLTNLPNRRMFHDHLIHEIKVSDRSGCPLALLFLDLDHFKAVNDELGHHTGDILLQESATRITACVRETDIVSRLSGDEFTVILSELEDREAVENIATKIIDSLCQPFKLREEIVYISVSIGIAIYPDDAKTISNLIKNADSAMYTAKNTGRNRFSYFTQSMHDAAMDRIQLLKELHFAVRNQQFQLRYQPIIDLFTGKIKKVEVLLCWDHPKRNFISPSEFIPAAEDSGLIVEIGDWVFKESIRQLKYWQQSYNVDIQISINKSPIQFNIKNGQNDWLHFLDEFKVSGNRIIIEITEGLLLDTSEKVIERLIQYRDMGIEIAIDDFGTGYSALSYLKKFDIDYLKIDRSFTKNVAFDSSDMALTEAITVMAHKLGLKVIVEGIEAIEQKELLIQAGCDFGQGYLFYKPMMAEDLEKIFQHQRESLLTNNHSSFQV